MVSNINLHLYNPVRMNLLEGLSKDKVLGPALDAMEKAINDKCPRQEGDVGEDGEAGAVRFSYHVKPTRTHVRIHMGGHPRTPGWFGSWGRR